MTSSFYSCWQLTPKSIPTIIFPILSSPNVRYVFVVSNEQAFVQQLTFAVASHVLCQSVDLLFIYSTKVFYPVLICFWKHIRDEREQGWKCRCVTNMFNVFKLQCLLWTENTIEILFLMCFGHRVDHMSLPEIEFLHWLSISIVWRIGLKKLACVLHASTRLLALKCGHVSV